MKRAILILTISFFCIACTSQRAKHASDAEVNNAVRVVYLYVGENGKVAPIRNIESVKRGNIRWRLNRLSPGYPIVDEFEIDFAEDVCQNPNRTRADADDDAICNIKEQASGCYGYDIVTYLNNNGPPQRLDPTIYVNEQIMLLSELGDRTCTK